MPGYTKGPWKVTVDGNNGEIATIHGTTRLPTEEGLGQEWVHIQPEDTTEWYLREGDEKLANAKLMAAAPDMYEALVDAMTEINSMKPTPALVAVALIAKAALAKAEGK